MKLYLLILVPLGLSASEPPQDPKQYIIYPPRTEDEFLERRRILQEALQNPAGARIIIKKRQVETGK